MTDKNYDPYYAKDGSVKCESLRDYFAVNAMQGIFSNGGMVVGATTQEMEWAAEKAYRMADAMLKARGE